MALWSKSRPINGISSGDGPSNACKKSGEGSRKLQSERQQCSLYVSNDFYGSSVNAEDMLNPCSTPGVRITRCVIVCCGNYNSCCRLVLVYALLSRCNGVESTLVGGAWFVALMVNHAMRHVLMRAGQCEGGGTRESTFCLAQRGTK